MAKMSRLTKFVEAATPFSLRHPERSRPRPNLLHPHEVIASHIFASVIPSGAAFQAKRGISVSTGPARERNARYPNPQLLKSRKGTSPTLHIPTSSRAEPLFRRREGSRSLPAWHASETHSIRILNC